MLRPGAARLSLLRRSECPGRRLLHHGAPPRRGRSRRASGLHALAWGVGRRIGFALVDAMAELHAVDPAAASLGDLGKPEGFVERQLSGWAKRWELAKPPDAPPVVEEVHRRL